MPFGDVVDELLNEDGLSHAGAAEQANFAAFRVGSQQVDDLDARFHDFCRGVLLGELGRRPVDGPAVRVGQFRAAVDDAAERVEEPSKGFFADWDFDSLAGCGNG